MKNDVERIIQSATQKSLDIYRKVISHRDDRLFTEFLFKGYRDMTIAGIDENYYAEVMIAKFHLGMLITLLDDFADHPQHLNSHLLTELYKLPFHAEDIKKENLNEHECAILDLVCYINNQIYQYIHNLPLYSTFKSIYQFDLLRCYQANQFSELMTQHNIMINSFELQHLRPFNMGIVAAGMIDLMASPQFDLNELGKVRHILHLAQRFGSICNNIVTLEREWEEGDITNEVIVKGLERGIISYEDRNTAMDNATLVKLNCIINELKLEQENIINEIAALNKNIKSIPCNQEVAGLKKLKILHESMQGIL